MSDIYTTEIPVRNLLGVEDAGLVTESRSIQAGQGILKAGTLLEEDGSKSSSSGELYCVLAFDTDTGVAGTSGVLGVTTYTAGSFLRHTIQAASGFELTAAQIADLRNKHIFLERSVGAGPPIPPGPPTPPAGATAWDGGGITWDGGATTWVN